MRDAYNELKQRGFLFQVTDETAAEKLLSEGPQTFYVGFDPTATSLHVGSLVPIIAMRIMQKWGHHPIVLVGGGTGMVGDPSGKTAARQLLTEEIINQNAAALKKQLSRFLDLDDGRGSMVDNKDWLLSVGYIEFLRDIGRHFSVNRMLTAESYKSRLESGLSFLEFNYMLLQAYDFMVLFRDKACRFQLGGQDQWGNIVAGIDLVRRTLQGDAYGITLPLLVSASGEKFGKSVSGAIWLDQERTSVFDYYQFWRNTEDADVARFLKLFTELPPEECDRLASLEAPRINRAKEILAYEITRITHGKDAAAQAFQAAASEYGEADPNHTIETTSGILSLAPATRDAGLPIVELTTEGNPLALLDILCLAGLCASKGEARRLIRGGGVKVNDDSISDEALSLTPDFNQGEFIVRAGKKRVVKVRLV